MAGPGRGVHREDAKGVKGKAAGSLPSPEERRERGLARKAFFTMKEGRP